MKNKNFDCVEMKNKLQKQLYEELKANSSDDYLKQLKKKFKQSEYIKKLKDKNKKSLSV